MFLRGRVSLAIFKIKEPRDEDGNLKLLFSWAGDSVYPLLTSDEGRGHQQDHITCWRQTLALHSWASIAGFYTKRPMTPREHAAESLGTDTEEIPGTEEPPDKGLLPSWTFCQQTHAEDRPCAKEAPWECELLLIPELEILEYSCASQMER